MYACRATPLVYIMVASRESEIIESSAVRITRYAPTFSLVEKMRSCTFIFVAFATILLYTKYINAIVVCNPENCLSSHKCEIESPLLCMGQQGTTCCSLVKPEFRTHCRHHGGECMDNCPPNLQQNNVVDCSNNQVCCVLV